MIIVVICALFGLCAAGGGWGDPSRYEPAVLEPGCPSEIKTCMREIHTDATSCLRLLWSSPGYQERKRCRSNNQVSFRDWWGASMEWHNYMKQCIAGYSAPVSSRWKREASWGNPQLDACWAQQKVRKDNCINSMLRSCPRLSACMGMGNEPVDEELRAWWSFMSPILVRKNSIKERFSAQARQPCP